MRAGVFSGERARARRGAGRAGAGQPADGGRRPLRRRHHARSPTSCRPSGRGASRWPRWTSGSSRTPRGCWPRAASRRTCCPPAPRSSAIEELGVGRVLPVQRPRRPGHRGRAGRADPAGAGAADPAVRDLLRQPDPRPRARAAAPTSCATATAASTSRWSSTPPAGWRSPRRTTGSRSRARRGSGSTPRSAGADHPHLPQRRQRRGPGRARGARVQRAVPPGGRRRARTTPPTCSTGSSS